MSIDCSDYIEGVVGLTPRRIYRSNPDALENRWGNFVYCMDLSPEPGDDELGNAGGAWTLWDLPVTHAAQIDDERGNDMIVVAIGDRVYVLDWERFRDEWEWDAYKPIYRMLRFAPIPHSPEAAGSEGAYDIAKGKTFREFYWGLKEQPTAQDSSVRVQVAEFENEANTARSTIVRQAQRNRVNLAVTGVSFVVTIEHAADEQWSPFQWKATWDIKGRTARLNSSAGNE